MAVAAQDWEERNRYFDRLANTAGLRWMGQNTNHLPLPPEVGAAIRASVESDEFRAYAPPLGFEALRAGIVADLGLAGMSAMVSDGGVEALYGVCHTFLRAGDRLITTDPTWKWPVAFARSVDAEVTQIPIYDPASGYRLRVADLAAAVDARTRMIYLVDPNNPLGTYATEDEAVEIAAIARRAGAILIQDCTYRHFAPEHRLFAPLYPEGAITIYSFSKWLGLAGLRIGAAVAAPELIARLAAAPPNNLGSNVVSQRAAMAGLAVKDRWFPQVQKTQRENQARIRKAVDQIPGLSMPVYPSGGNFVCIECADAGVRPELLVAAMQEHRILIRQGSYHTARFGDRFVKVSTTVPSEWVEEFCVLLPRLVEQTRGRNAEVRLY